MKRVLRRCLLLVAWIVLGTFGGLVLAVGLPNAFHAKSLTVMSGSMEPTIGTGDVVVARQTSPMDVRVGDIVTFRDPLEHDRLITHRVREMHVEGDTVVFVTKGDANTGVEHWALGKDGTIGRVAFHVPKIGLLHGLVPLPVRPAAAHRLAHAPARDVGALAAVASAREARAGRHRSTATTPDPAEPRRPAERTSDRARDAAETETEAPR